MRLLALGSVIAAGSAATGTPPLLPRVFWMPFFIVMSMKSYASCLFFAPLGTTHRLPPEPSVSLEPGKGDVPHSSLISDLKRPNHQLAGEEQQDVHCRRYP